MKKDNKPYPPKWASRFLYWYCKQDLLEEIEGDINEGFYAILKNKGQKDAKRYYTSQVLRFFRPFAITSIKINNMFKHAVLKNYLKVSLRNLRSDLLNTSLSILGLFLALLCSMVIYRVAQNELTHDQFHKKAENIYRVNYDETKNPNSSRRLPTVGPPLGPAIKEFYPEVKDAVRLRYSRPSIVAHNDLRFNEDGIFYVDPSFFSIFTYPLTKGSAETALSQANHVVITEEMALKYFGDEDPMSKIITINNSIPYKITGVIKTPPNNSHLKFDFLLPFEAFKVPYGYPVTLNDWGWISFYTYVELQEGADAKALEAKLPEFAADHFEEERASRFDYKLQPLSAVYFGDIHSENMASGTMNYIYGLITVGVMLILLASFNFINIFIAKSVNRAKESGVRKTLGASKNSLWIRYLMEPVMIVLMAFALALIILPQSISFINIGLSKNIPLAQFQYLELALIFLAFSLLVGVLAGIYPALVMSSYSTSSIAKGRFKSSVQGIRLRKGLLVLQFIITTLLIGSNLIVSSQIIFIQNKDLGFDKDEIIMFELPGRTQERYFEALRTQLLTIPAVEEVVVGGGRMDGKGGSVPIAVEGQEEPRPLTIQSVKYNYFSTMGIEIIAGREFSRISPNDSTDGIIINEAAAKVFGWSPEEALQKAMRVGEIMEGHVLGVVKNYHFTSLHDPIEPIIIYFPRDLNNDIYARIKSGADVKELVASINREWQKVIPEVPFDYAFLNTHLDQLYQTDIEFSTLINYLTILIIIIASLGLYGLMALVNQQKEQEMSIRKVFGASVTSIIITFSKPFVTLIIVANVIAWPLILLLSQEWLGAFEYQTSLSWGVFALPIILTLAIVGIALLLQIVRIIRVNPTETLKYE
jgi:putative ABC transport system permease protein